MTKKIKLIGQLDGDKVIVSNNKIRAHLETKAFGEKYDNYTVLDVYETLYLMEKRNMSIFLKNKEMTKEEIIEHILKITDKQEIMHKFHVYKEIREKGHIIKTGLKFGFDFRVYPLGKNPGESHTEFVIEVWPQDRVIKPELIARSIRMALGLHATFVLAIIDNELECSYYSLGRTKF